MKILLIFLFLSFISGQILSFALADIRISLLDIAVLVNVIYFIFSTKALKKTTKKWYLSVFGPFLAIALISLIITRLRYGLTNMNWLISGLYLVRFTLYSFLVAIGVWLKKTARISLPGLFISGSMIALLGLLQYWLYPDLRNLYYLGWDPHHYRVFSTMLDPNFTGIILVLTLWLGIYLYLTLHKNTLLHLLVILALGFDVLALLLTYSRGSFIAFLFGLGLWCYRRNKFFIFLLALGFFCASILMLPKSPGESVDLSRTISVWSRWQNSQEAIGLWLNAPVLGHGFNVFGIHNSWLFILATTGVLGMLSYLWIWCGLYKKVKSVAEKSHQQTYFQLWKISVLTVFLHSLFDNSLFFAPLMFWLWILTGNLFNPENRKQFG